MISVVLVTTGQPSINPRVVKEADALHSAGHDVTVLYCSWIKWAEDADKVLLNRVKWKHQQIGGSSSKNKAVYFFTKARFKFFKILNKRFGSRFLIAERSQARCYDELLTTAKSIKADCYIGHNLGALSIAVKAATYRRAAAGFDFEDYHREENADMPEYERKKIVYLEEKYVPSLKYISTSSPLITNETLKNFSSYRQPVITLMNCFPLTVQPKYVSGSACGGVLKLFWFSQTVGKNRGIETLIEALERLSDPSIHLTLAGRCDKDMKEYIQKRPITIQRNIHLAGIIPPGDLPAFSATFDIGLALETGFSINNNIALSNKIFTYLLAGNAVILSNTAMQQSFNQLYKVGETFEVNDAEALAAKILGYKNLDKLNSQRLYNYKLAKNLLNWENESRKLLNVIEEHVLCDDFIVAG